MKRISLSMLDKLFAAVNEHLTLYLPIDDESGQAQFAPWQEGKKLSDKLNTVKSAKDLFFPQVENLMEFRIKNKNIELVENHTEEEPFAVFGIRACDCRSFDILDRVFLSELIDTYYKKRRESGVIITLACNRPSETCFCTVFGIDPTEPEGDISCIKDSEYLYWSANTEKGKALTLKLNMLEECDSSAAEKEKNSIRTTLEYLPLKELKLDGFDEEHMLEIFNSDKWKELSQSCIGCGTCTYVCPTCQCYDIQEFDTGKSVKRFRCWDSCMYSNFTKMSAGQPRPTQLERFRQRFMHKLVYYPSNNDGIYSCVGCGRCLRKCPISMNIAKVIKKLKEE